MTTNELREAAQRLLRVHLDNVEVHPCDHNNDRVRAAHCMPEVRDLYKALTDSSATTNEAAAQADGRALEPTAMRLARLIITEHYADEPSAESLVDEAWRVLGCLPETVVNRALDLNQGVRMPYEQALSLAISEHATQPVQAQGEAVAEVTHGHFGQGVKWLNVMPIPGGAKLYTHPAPAVDRGLSEVVREALVDAKSVCASVSTDRYRKLVLSGSVMYAQTEEWCRWAYDEVLPKIKAALAASAPSQAEPTHRHIKRGTTYTERARGRLQVDEGMILRDMCPLVAYQSTDDGEWWFRPVADFDNPRRFEKVAPSQAGSCQASGPCKTCRGSGVVDDGWMTHSEGGAEFNEPIKCVKDCPDCGKTAPPAGRTLTEWPRSRDVKRPEDMGDAQLRVLFDSDNDVIVELWTPGQRSIAAEFCNAMNGGGKSPKTRMALIALMVAMEADAASSTTAGERG